MSFCNSIHVFCFPCDQAAKLAGKSGASTPVVPPPQDADEVEWVKGPAAPPKAMPGTSWWRQLQLRGPAFSKAAQASSQSSRAHVLRQLLSDSHRFHGMVMGASLAPPPSRSTSSNEMLALEWVPPEVDETALPEAAPLADAPANEAEPEEAESEEADDDEEIPEPPLVKRRISYKRPPP